MVRTLDRRTFLRGAGGVVVALPALEIMGRQALAQAGVPPKRFLVSFGGVSTGSDNFQDDFLVPSSTGAGYEIRPALQPLADHGVADAVALVSGLKVPWKTGSTIPPGGRESSIHYRTVGPQVAGTHSTNSGGGYPQAPTCDQLVADVIAGDTVHRVLGYRLQADAGGSSGRFSWEADGPDGVRPVDPIASPRVAYDALFTGFSPSDPTEAAQVRAALLRRRSVLDLVRDNTQQLVGRLGMADQQRMELHLDQIRELERRLAAVPDGGGGGGCQPPAHPGDDPPVGDGWSGEDVRADVFVDLIALAFACDLSRVSSFLLTEWKCYLDMDRLTGGQFSGDMHSMTHSGGNQPGVTAAVAWLVDPFARILARLRDTPEVDGSTVLDHTAAVLLFEGGHGYDVGTGRNDRSHSTENMVALVGGRAGGLNAGHHIVTSELHPAQAVLTAMQAVGYQGDQLGEVSGIIPGLRG